MTYYSINMEKATCNIGYSCGEACINTGYKCKTKMQGESAELADKYMKRPKRPPKRTTKAAGKPSSGKTQEELFEAMQAKAKAREAKLAAKAEAREAKKQSRLGPKKEAEKSFDTRLSERRSKLKEKFGEEKYAEYNNKLKDIFSDVVPAIFMTEDTVSKIKASDDKVLKTVFETGTSGGEQNKDARRKAEKISLGIAEDMPDDKRPIYAGVFKPNTTLDDTAYQQYGDIALSPKEFDRSQVSLTLNDSIDQADDMEPDAQSLATRLDSDDLMSLLPISDELDYDRLTNSYAELIDEMFGIGSTYLEMQIYERPLSLDKLYALKGEI